MKCVLGSAILAVVVTVTAETSAYPTSVVFTPTAEVSQPGEFAFLGYTGVNLNPSLTYVPSWLGYELGVIRPFEYGNSGVGFGGLEAGMDIIVPYENGAKPVVNAKLNFLTEGKYSPALSLGAMEVTTAAPSMSYVYLTQTKRFDWGRLTVGFGSVLGDRSTYQPTFPFRRSRGLFMAAYESPMVWGRLGVIVDHVGGVSEISSTYAGAAFQASKPIQLQLGGYFSNDRAQPFDGLYSMIVVTLDFSKRSN